MNPESQSDQQKMQEIKEYFSRQFELEDAGRIGNGLPICWVEEKKGGLKMSLKYRIGGL